MSYRTGNRPPPAPHNDGRYSTAARAAAAVVRARAEAGEPCWFWRDPRCPGLHWDWTLPYWHKWAYTTHHLDRLMDGGQPDPDPARMAPAHRGCNARDGLHAQNARRYGAPTTTATATERTSRTW
jgi:hypothetical protein